MTQDMLDKIKLAGAIDALADQGKNAIALIRENLGQIQSGLTSFTAKDREWLDQAKQAMESLETIIAEIYKVKSKGL